MEKSMIGVANEHPWPASEKIKSIGVFHFDDQMKLKTEQSMKADDLLSAEEKHAW